MVLLLLLLLLALQFLLLPGFKVVSPVRWRELIEFIGISSGCASDNVSEVGLRSNSLVRVEYRER